MTSTVTGPDLAAAERDATATRETADALRARLEAGDTGVTAQDLAVAEQQERHAELVVTAARRADQQRREQEAADQLQRERDAIQAEWSALPPGEPEHVQELRKAAAIAAADYLEAAGVHANYAFDLHDRAKEAGFRVPERSLYTKPPLPILARDILRAAKGRCPEHWLYADQNSPRGTMWGE